MVTEAEPPEAGPTVREHDERSDADLLQAHVDGDHEAFGVLFHRHRDRLWAVALRTTGDREVAADGLQDGMVAAFRRAGSYRGEARVTTWLHRVVVNACLDRLRAAKVRRADPLPEDVDDQDRLVRATPDRSRDSDPAEHVIVSARRAAVLDALGSLSPEQRAAVVLVDMEGHTVAETATILDCAEGTVKSRCSRARARLAVLLSDLLSDALDDRDREHPLASAPERNPKPSPDVGSGNRRGPPAAP